MKKWFERLRGWVAAGAKPLLPLMFVETSSLDLRIVGRTLLHTALVGLAAGAFGVAFFVSLEWMQLMLLERAAGYVPLRAHGEHHLVEAAARVPFNPWLLTLLPAVGGLLAGLLIRLAPETAGGGGDAAIDAFHHRGGHVRRRVIWVKALASIATLGTGGAGGREGPTMQIGAALGSYVGRVLGVSARERRILLVAGIAAGISAVFRTPLGAALLAVEILYRDGFESDALVPAILASVISYSVVISILGETTLFAHSPRFPFLPAHLPLYGVLALVVAFVAASFVSVLKAVRRAFERLRIPKWTKPGLGGLLLGVLATTVMVVVGARMHTGPFGLGILGGGYGSVQLAISGAAWLPAGWTAVQLLLLMALVKIVASSFTIGSGGSAGDFAPSLAIGGLLGGAFGRAAQLTFSDPRIDPGAFALVGMGVFYGGIAHVPLSALVLVCELAGNYDLLVPLMLAQAIAFVALRNRALYDAQLHTPKDSPVHRDALLLDLFRALKVSDVMIQGRPHRSFLPSATTSEMLEQMKAASWQGVFPVVDPERGLIGLVTATALRVQASLPSQQHKLAEELMQLPVRLRTDDDLRTATELMADNGLRELPVLDERGSVVAFLDQADIARVYLRAERPAPS